VEAPGRILTTPAPVNTNQTSDRLSFQTRRGANTLGEVEKPITVRELSSCPPAAQTGNPEIGCDYNNYQTKKRILIGGLIRVVCRLAIIHVRVAVYMETSISEAAF
jgi:hypothetical protein